MSSVHRRLVTVLLVAFVLTPLFSFLIFGRWTIVELLYSPFFTAAMGGVFVIHAVLRPRARELAGTTLLGILLAVLHTYGGIVWLHEPGSATLHLPFGLGAASMLWLLASSWRAGKDERDAISSVLLPALILPLFVSASGPLLALTAILHPTVYDLLVYSADRLYGAQPSFAAGVLFERMPGLAKACYFVYYNLPLPVALVYAVRRRAHGREQGDVLLAFLAIGLVGFVLYHAFPVAGPVYFFGDHFPHDPFPMAPRGMVLPLGVMRNCMPSLHTAWALLLFWYGRGLKLWLRAALLLWLLATLLGTLGFGFHYAMDLVVAFPFTLAIRAAFSGAPRGRRLLLAATLATAGWLALLRFWPPDDAPTLPWRFLLAALTVCGTLWAEARLELPAGQPEVGNRAGSPVPNTRAERNIAALFFVSGFAALIYEVVFAKALSLTFGSTATASATVLAAYMGGMSLGSWLGGDLGQKRSDPLRLYAGCEIAIALYCAATPWLFSGLRWLYVALARGSEPGAAKLIALQILLGALGLLPATILMGMTLPILTKQFLSRAGLGRSIGLLYGANTLGAASGALLTGYLVLPFFGVNASTWLAVAGNLIVGYLALRLAARTTVTTAATQRALGESPELSPRIGQIATAMLAVGGVLTLALETTAVHLLSVVAGNSVYAFSLMLFSFLIGLGLGASAARRVLARLPASLFGLALVECALAATIVASAYGWEGIPDYFASFDQYPATRSFATRELVRFTVCAGMLTPPAFFIGCLYPIALDLITRATPTDPIRATGRAAALNTFGNIVGSLLGGLWLVPKLGSLKVLILLAGLALLLGLLPLLTLGRRERLQLAGLSLAVLALFSGLRSRFDYDRLASGANVYFAKHPYGHVIAAAESLDGGLTTVNETQMEAGRVLTLLTNGKFQGDNGGEMKSQYGFALYPLLHTSARDAALVIGLGTGVSASTLHRAGFQQVDVAELSADLASLADRYFGDVNGSVLHQPGVTLHISDGRNLLLLSRQSYDLVTIEVSSIWFAGAASLYSQEFYRLVHAHLRPHGVFQQWIQLHHISGLDITAVLATVRHEFPHVSLYFSGAQGVIVACSERCPPSAATYAAIDQAPGLADILATIGTSSRELRSDRLLSPDGVNHFVPDMSANKLGMIDLISTDDNLLLDYSTPRGNVNDYRASLEANLALLRPFSRPAPRSELPTPSELGPAREPERSSLDP